MGLCNHCKIKHLKEKARLLDRKVTRRASLFNGGIDVYMHPKSIKIPVGYRHKADCTTGYDQYFVMWCKEIPNKCGC